MTNSDYFIKATVKKISERLNQTFIGKFEEAANAAQDAPEILKKEIENLKDEILKEAYAMEEAERGGQNIDSDMPNASNNPTIQKSLRKIELINNSLDKLNNLLDN
tara:strand:+ start:98 stop:415 length:318 start_codon:yes stop_codon:yes gene_type:complete